jgi:hypothetical protein
MWGLRRDFLVPFLDFSKAPETQMWLYSSIENTAAPGDETVCEQQFLKLLVRVKEIEEAYEAQRETPGVLLIGSLHKRTLQLLQTNSLVKTRSPEYFKCLFRLQDLPLEKQLPDGLSWSSVRPTDMPLILSRTAIPYKESVNPFIKDSRID